MYCMSCGCMERGVEETKDRRLSSFFLMGQMKDTQNSSDTCVLWNLRWSRALTGRKLEEGSSSRFGIMTFLRRTHVKKCVCGVFFLCIRSAIPYWFCCCWNRQKFICDYKFRKKGREIFWSHFLLCRQTLTKVVL